MKKEDSPFDEIYRLYTDSYKTQGYFLDEVFDIYLPFWRCKQKVFIEKEIELDRFSRILLTLIKEGLNKHEELSSFLGIEKDSFVNMQFHYLLKQNFIREIKQGIYEITNEGIDSLENRNHKKNIEPYEFEYYYAEKSLFFKHDLDNLFFNLKQPFDENLSSGKVNSFSGYRLLDPRNLNPTRDSMIIGYEKKPNFYYEIRKWCTVI